MRAALCLPSNRVSRWLNAVLVCFAAVTVLAASQARAAGPGNAAPPPSNIWRTAAQTVYDDPRGIVLERSTRFRGTVSLPPGAASGQIGQHALKDINWLVSLTNRPEDIYVTGGGTYTVTASVGVLQVIGHRMTVDLKWGNEGPTRRFDSGVVPRSAASVATPVDIVLYEVPATTATSVPQPNQARASLRLALAPVPLQQIVRYTVTDALSRFAFGCFDPCLCPVASQSMSGEFDLVPLTSPAMGNPRSDGTLEWAMVNIRTVAPSARTPVLTPQPSRTFRGEGIFQWSPTTVASNTATHSQRLRARLTDSLRTTAPQPERFDSGTVAVTVPWPKLHIAIADNHFHCFNRVLYVSSIPRPNWGGAVVPSPQPVGYP